MPDRQFVKMINERDHVVCKTLVHLFMPDIFTYVHDLRYTPPIDLSAHNETLDVTHFVLIQPNCDGTDNRALCLGLAVLGGDCVKCVVVLDIECVADEELRALHHQGVHAIRMNLSISGQADIACLRASISRAEARIVLLFWHMQIFANLTQLALLLPLIRVCNVPVVLDHFAGGAAMADNIAGLLNQPNVWGKLSAPSRVSTSPGYSDLANVVRRFITIASERLMWASDWPHSGGHGRRNSALNESEPFVVVNDCEELHRLAWWVDYGEVFRQNLTTNAYALNDF